ncbi:MAG: hypothetical protein HRF43_00175 [Phycisphaerae bacterium]|jgi:hypothetical protein
MSAPPCFFYADEATRERLARPGPRVLLVGGYGGFGNFGDVLQLKGALAWHRSAGEREPVVVCHACAIPDAGYCGRLRRWFGVREVLFWSPEALDLGVIGLERVMGAAPIAHLHVYGGALLNRYWGATAVGIIEGLIEQFGAGHYVLSGQQVDERFVSELRGHFERYRPVLAGGRDPESARLLAECGVEADDSFDDAIEMIETWADRARNALQEPFDLLVHLNLSYYTGESDLAELGGQLARVAAHAGQWAGGRHPRVALLNAYSDRRADEVCDALGTVQQLEDLFPFLRFEVFQLGQMALEFAGSEPEAPMVPGAKLALACSYHVSILCARLGVPCYLSARNAYYRQKRDGLGMAGDLDSFLRDPRAVSLEPRLAARRRWLHRMSDAYRLAPSARAPAGPAPVEGAPRPWVPKSRGAQLASLQAELQKGAQAWREQQAYIGQLHEAKAWLEGQMNEWRRQALEGARAVEELRAYVAQLEEAVRRAPTRGGGGAR